MATKKLPTFSQDELRKALANEQTGANLTATLDDFTGGTLSSTVDLAAAQQAAALTPDKEFSITEKWDAFRRNTNTNFITNIVLDKQIGDDFAIFDPTINHPEVARSLLEEFNVPVNEETMQAMSKGGTVTDMTTLAKRLSQHQFDLEVLDQHGAVALASGILDPATLVVDMATFGTTKALKLGRLAAGTAGATANVGVLAAAEAGGKEVDAWEYITTAALSGGVFALFGGDIGAQIATGQRNWFGGLSKDRPSAITRLLSEADTVAPTPTSRAYVKDLIDDPVRRDDYFNNDNAGALKRVLDNKLEGDLSEFDDALHSELARTYGHNQWSRVTDVSGKYSDDWELLQEDVAQELLRRDAEFIKYGHVLPDSSVPKQVKELADKHEQIMNKSGQISRDYGISGFEEFTPRPGYFHRKAMPEKIRAFESDPKFGRNAVLELVTRAIRGGISAIDHADAAVVARAWVDRAIAKEAGMSTDLMGLLGKKDTESIFDLLNESNLDEATKQSIISRLESKLGEKGLPKYARQRIPMDMRVAYTAADGSTMRMVDLIDTNLSRVNKNYIAAMNGRAALAKAGIGTDDAAIQSWYQGYIKSIEDLPPNQYQQAIDQMDSLLGEFTGNIPAKEVPGQYVRWGMSLANSTMLAAQGLWQGAEYATMAYRFGVAQTAKEFFRQFPGVKGALTKMNGHPDLVDELRNIMDVDLARDIRYRPFNNQHDTFIAANGTVIDRVLHLGKQAMPYVTGMKYIHTHQVRMASNLALTNVANAMRGDAKALADLKAYGKDVDWAGIIARNAGKVSYIDNTGPVRSMNWEAWTRADSDAVMNVVLRYVDDTILFGRVGQGAAFSRTVAGQVLGQFRSFVSLANNKLLRGTIENDGYGAMGLLLAYQYPMTLLMVTLNEARKGTLGDLNDEDYQKELAIKAVGYTSALGFYADAFGVLGLTGRGGLSAPILAAAGAPAQIINGVKKQVDGDPHNDNESLHDVAKGVSTLIPVLGALPGSAYAINSMKGD